MPEIDGYGSLGPSAFAEEVAEAWRLCDAASNVLVRKEYVIDDEETGEIVVEGQTGTATGIPEVDALNDYIRRQEAKGLSIILAWSPGGPVVVGAAERAAVLFSQG